MSEPAAVSQPPKLRMYIVIRASVPTGFAVLALDGQEVAIAFKPRAEYPKAFRFFKLFK
jgi:hypothetical protein